MCDQTTADQTGAAVVQVAEFGPAHGVSGRIKVRCYTQDPSTVARLGPVFDTDGVEYHLTQTGTWKDGIVVSIADVRNRDQAELLRGKGLFISRHKLPDLDTDEVYHVDLIGVQAEVTGREASAEIVAFHNFGAGDIVEVQPSWLKATVMVPFDPAYITQLDVAAGRVVIEDVPGLFPEEDAGKTRKKRRRSEEADEPDEPEGEGAQLAESSAPDEAD